VRIKFVLAFAISFSASATAQDANPFAKYVVPWGEKAPEFAWRSEEGAYTWVYEKDVTRKNGEATAWVHSQWDKPKADGVSRILSRMTFDCAGRMRYSAQSTYDALDKVIENLDSPGDWTYIRPDTLNHDIEAKLCAIS
jgi:hypothetical protein